MKKNAFTMIELVFVIVILGILASIAIPRLAATREDAQITKAASDIAAIRSGIVTTYNAQLLQGNNKYPNLEGADTDKLFDNILTYGISPGTKSGQWSSVVDNKTYKIKIETKDIEFNYNITIGTFNCDSSNSTTGTTCKILTR